MNEILVGAWLVPVARTIDASGERDVMGNRMMVFSMNDPIQMIAQHDFSDDVEGTGGDFLYQPASDSIWIFGDFLLNKRVRASDFTPLPTGPVKLFIFGRDYDPARDDGVVCGVISIDGQGWTNVAAFHGSPPMARRLVTLENAPLLVPGVATGCAVDGAARKAYVMFMNLGLLARFDYDSGRLEKTAFVGVGLRNITLDGRRRRLYLTDYLRRDIVAVDADSLDEVRRWAVGRYTRDIRLTRDGTALLVGSTVGLLRIGLSDATNAHSRNATQ